MRSGLILVALYYFTERLLIALLVFPLSHIIEHLGFRRSVAVSLIFLIAYTVTLILVGHNWLWMWVAALFLAIQTPFYWISRDSVIAQDSSIRDMGKNMANLAAWERIATIVGPLLGGLLLSVYGFLTLYTIAGISLLLSAFPLWKMHSHTHRNGVSLTGFVHYIRDRRYAHIAISNFAMSVHDYSLTVIWPLILFFKGIHDKVLGGLFAAVAVVSLLVEFMSGRIFDKLHKRGDWSDEFVFGLASIGNSATWIVRLFIVTLRQVLVVDLIGGLLVTLSGEFFGDYLHLGGKRMGSIAYWVYEEVVYSLGCALLFALMALGARFNVWSEIVLLSAAWWSLVAIVAARESNMK
jgi:hypothetical protein